MGWLCWSVAGPTHQVPGFPAPRYFHLNFGAQDLSNPIEFIKDGLKRIQNIYDTMGEGSKFSFYIDDQVGHTLTDEMWKRVVEVFKVALT